MRASGLLDTGAIIALLDSGDPWHTKCAPAFESQQLPLGTTTAVLTELFHLIRRYRGGPQAAKDFVLSGAVTILPMTDQDLPEIERLMNRYADRSMDFADATLVRAGSRHNLTTILTVDHDDFETYRMDRKTEVPNRSLSVAAE